MVLRVVDTVGIMIRAGTIVPVIKMTCSVYARPSLLLSPLMRASRLRSCDGLLITVLVAVAHK